MESFLKMLDLQIEILLLMALGFFIKKSNIISASTQKELSSLLLSIFLPANILTAFLVDLSVENSLFINAVEAILISLFIQTFSILISKVLFKKSEKGLEKVMSYGLIVSNSSFIGIPVIEAMYGSMGTIYSSIFQIPIRITMWTAGIALFSKEKKKSFKEMILNPCIIAVFIGIILMLTHIKLPTILFQTLSSIGKCTTPISMIVIGALLSDINWKKIFDCNVLYFSVLRLILFPLLVLLVLSMLPIDPLIVKISVLMTGMPAGGTTAILAERYSCDSEFAAKIIFISTVFSIITLPIITFLI